MYKLLNDAIENIKENDHDVKNLAGNTITLADRVFNPDKVNKVISKQVKDRFSFSHGENKKSHKNKKKRRLNKK